MTSNNVLANFINGQWLPAMATDTLDVVNPATGEVLAAVPLGAEADVGRAVEAAARAFPEWRRTPPVERVQYLFKLKVLLEENLDEIARLITMENGKTLVESRGELRRAIENVEVACGIPTLMQGYNLEDVASGIDEHMIRQPIGVVAAVTPFNFPVMVPLWFLPYAIACGNTFVLKPSERVPVAITRVFELLERTGLPAGVVNLVHGAKAAVDALLDHPDVRAVSFVGSTPVARYIYARAAGAGKRVQCQGGAKNPVVIMPDADMEMAAQIVSESAFGCAGQRCLAVSLALPVAEARRTFTEAIAERARSIRVGYGLEDGVQMGPVITRESKARIEALIARGASHGARLLLDGRGIVVPSYERGNFIAPTILDGLPPESDLATTEIFGPVLSLIHVQGLDEAIELMNRNPYGNMASIFTSSGAAARKFRSEVMAGNIGINIGVAAPMAFFPFSGWKDSFFGVLHGQGRDAVEFYTEKKVIVERWPKEWSRIF
ncbi:MAG TPA: CoA-acylating methylmalonate-semialdehyde dehydrogenase [Blastocatellia bacterium]|nr:CoA-acylating methylmalonate-semialdehyde dehydrogenase [Blastocatellia bacterium]